MWFAFSPEGLLFSRPLDSARLIRFPKSNFFELLMDFYGKRLSNVSRMAENLKCLGLGLR
jgi:hypothetical protein